MDGQWGQTESHHARRQIWREEDALMCRSSRLRPNDAERSGASEALLSLSARHRVR